MDKFECKNCGACCTKFGVMGALPFFEWEIIKVKKEADKRKIKLNIQPINLMLDEISGLYFFPQYGMFNEPCPFLGQGKCLIYSKRPYVCRMFPLIKIPLFEEIKIKFDWFSFCPNFDLKKFVEETNSENLNQEELNKKFEEFGECNRVCFRATRTRNKLDEIIKRLIDKGKVKLNQIKEGEEIKKPLSIMEFLVRIKAITPREKREIIREFER